MIRLSTQFDDVWIMRPTVYGDERGYFYESYQQEFIEEQVGKIDFVLEFQSYSNHNVVRGLHYQTNPFAQSKLVKVIQGKVIDIIVDIRKSSPSFGKHLAIELSDETHDSIFIPKGYAHGFIVLSDYAIMNYKLDNSYSPQHYTGINILDPQLNISFIHEQPIISHKDAALPLLNDAQLF